MDKSAFDQQKTRLLEQMAHIDAVALVVLKGHLVLEEQLDGILEKFVFHPTLLGKAGLRFFQKVVLARSLSLDEHENPMWDLVSALNGLRNVLSHALDSRDRLQKSGQVLSAFSKAGGVLEKENESSDEERIACTIAFASGFLHTFESEASRFQSIVQSIDRVMNSHRHHDEKKTTD